MMDRENEREGVTRATSSYLCASGGGPSQRWGAEQGHRSLSDCLGKRWGC